MPVTMRMIAQAANVSVTTVSNVLRNQGRVSEETRKRILQIAQEMGYFKQLPPQVTGQIGVIFYNPNAPTCSDANVTLPETTSSYTSEAIEGIEQIVSERGYHLVFQIIRDPNPPVPKMVEERIVEGILVIGGTVADEFVAQLSRRNIPLVLLFTEHPTLEVNCVLADNQRGAYKAVKHLCALGHTRIGFINGWAATHTSAAKLAGYRQALAEAGLSFEPKLYCEGDFTSKSGATSLAALIEADPGLTAVFVADDTMALGVLKAAKKIGRRVPQDLAIIGFGNSPFSLHTEPPLATVAVPKKKIGELAAQRLLQLCAGEQGYAKILLATQLILRESCGVKPSAATTEG